MTACYRPALLDAAHHGACRLGDSIRPFCHGVFRHRSVGPGWQESARRPWLLEQDRRADRSVSQLGYSVCVARQYGSSGWSGLDRVTFAPRSAAHEALPCHRGFFLARTPATRVPQQPDRYDAQTTATGSPHDDERARSRTIFSNNGSDLSPTHRTSCSWLRGWYSTPMITRPASDRAHCDRGKTWGRTVRDRHRGMTYRCSLWWRARH